jgi:hypothetical protein
MIRRSRGTRYAAGAGNTGNDTDALQTDVMRFMSILGLCLMAVFALVQSIPLREADSAPPGPQREALLREIQLQQERSQLLNAELDRLTAQLQQTRELQRQARQRLSETVGETEHARNTRDRMAAELEALRRQLTTSRVELTRIEQAAQTKADSLRSVQERLREQQARLDQLRQAARTLRPASPATPAAPVVDRSPSARPMPKQPPPSRPGFTLRFASAEALDRLVASGTVRLYAMADEQAWRLSLEGGQPQLSPQSLPRWFHEMAPSTVPAHYLRTLAASMERAQAQPVVWGVQLPPATTRGITALTRGLSGGDLVINADGRVRLEGE